VAGKCSEEEEGGGGGDMFELAVMMDPSNEFAWGALEAEAAEK